MAQDLNSLIAGGADLGSVGASLGGGFSNIRNALRQQPQQQPQPGALPRDINGNIDYRAAASQLLGPYAVGGSAYGATPTYVPGYGYRPMF